MTENRGTEELIGKKRRHSLKPKNLKKPCFPEDLEIDDNLAQEEEPLEPLYCMGFHCDAPVLARCTNRGYERIKEFSFMDYKPAGLSEKAKLTDNADNPSPVVEGLNTLPTKQYNDERSSLFEPTTSNDLHGMQSPLENITVQPNHNLLAAALSNYSPTLEDKLSSPADSNIVLEISSGNTNEDSLSIIENPTSASVCNDPPVQEKEQLKKDESTKAPYFEIDSQVSVAAAIPPQQQQQQPEKVQSMELTLNIANEPFVNNEIISREVSDLLKSTQLGTPQNPINARYKNPFFYGWKRELVWRAPSENSSKKADVYYITPAGRKTRSRVDVQQFLSNGLSVDDFYFKREETNAPAQCETVRFSKTVTRIPNTVKSRQAETEDFNRVVRIGKRVPIPKAPKGASPPPRNWSATSALKENNAALRRKAINVQKSPAHLALRLPAEPAPVIRLIENSVVDSVISSAKQNENTTSALREAKKDKMKSLEQQHMNHQKISVLGAKKYIDLEHKTSTEQQFDVPTLNEFANGQPETSTPNKLVERDDFFEKLKSGNWSTLTEVQQTVEKQRETTCLNVEYCKSEIFCALSPDDFPHLEKIRGVITGPEFKLNNGFQFQNLSCLDMHMPIHFPIEGGCLKQVAKHLKLEMLSLTGLHQLTDEMILDLMPLKQLTVLRIGNVGHLTGDSLGTLITSLDALKYLRIEQDFQSNGEILPFNLQKVIEAIGTKENVERLELININILVELDKLMKECIKIKQLLLVPSYNVAQPYLVNATVVATLEACSDNLQECTWYINTEKGLGINPEMLDPVVPLCYPTTEDQTMASADIFYISFEKLCKQLKTCLKIVKFRIPIDTAIFEL